MASALVATLLAVFATVTRSGLLGRVRVAEGAEARRVRSPTAPGTAVPAAGTLPGRSGTPAKAPPRRGRSFAEAGHDGLLRQRGSRVFRTYHSERPALR
jgi:hypothetical protein